MATPGSIVVRDGASRLAVRRGDYLPTTIDTILVENALRAVINTAQLPLFYYLSMRLPNVPYQYQIALADAAGNPIGVNLPFIGRTGTTLAGIVTSAGTIPADVT